MPYKYWFAAVIDRAHPEHQKILDQSVSIFSAADFVRLLSERKFIETWQSIREDVNDARTFAIQGRVILDSLWSLIMTGEAFGHYPDNIQKPLSKQLKATYANIRSRSAKNIYQVARDMNRPYSRVYADVKRLQAMGLVNASSKVQAGRRVTLLSARY